jgi:hypothetical protein
VIAHNDANMLLYVASGVGTYFIPMRNGDQKWRKKNNIIIQIEKKRYSMKDDNFKK